MGDGAVSEATGGCQCGAVRWRVADAPTAVELCHCSMCRRAVGNVFMTAISVPKDAVVWTGERTVYRSSPIATRSFCGMCGTPLTFAYDASDKTDLMAGTVDDPAALRPDRHFGVEGRLEAFRHLDGLEEERSEDNARLQELWREAGGGPGRA